MRWVGVARLLEHRPRMSLWLKIRRVERHDRFQQADLQPTFRTEAVSGHQQG